MLVVLIYLRHNLSQALVAELFGCSQPTVSRLIGRLAEIGWTLNDTPVPLTRRQWLRTAASGAAALALAPLAARAADAPGFTLPKLPYGFDALEPNIDAILMSLPPLAKWT